MAERPLLVTERIVPVPFRARPLTFWFLVFLFAVAASVAAGWQLPERKSYWALTVAQALGIFSIPLVFKYCHLQFIKWSKNARAFIVPSPGDAQKDVEQWLARELQFFESSFLMCLFALGVSIFATCVMYLSGRYIPAAVIPAIVAVVVIFASSFQVGLGLYVISSGFRMLRRLGRFRIRVSSHRFGVLSTGVMIVKILFVVSLIWGVYVSSSVFGIAYAHDPILHNRSPLLILALPTLCFFIMAFVLCQQPLHRRMVEFKKDELFRIEQALERFDGVDFATLSLEDKERLELCLYRKDAVLSLPEWPFGLSAILAMATSGLAVLWPAFINPLMPTILRFLKDIIGY